MDQNAPQRSITLRTENGKRKSCAPSGRRLFLLIVILTSSMKHVLVSLTQPPPVSSRPRNPLLFLLLSSECRYTHQLYAPTKTAPPTELPRVIGSMQFHRKAPIDRGALSIIPIDVRHIYSTVCGYPVVVDMKNGKCRPNAFDIPSSFCVPKNIASVTKKPQAIALSKITRHGESTMSLFIWLIRPDRYGSSLKDSIRYENIAAANNAPIRFPTHEATKL